jgi:hypothetical protein
MNRSASGGLNFGIGFMKCCDMRTLAHECLVVPVACSARWLSRQCSPRAAASLWFFGSAVPAELARGFRPREKISPA